MVVLLALGVTVGGVLALTVAGLLPIWRDWRLHLAARPLRLIVRERHDLTDDVFHVTLALRSGRRLPDFEPGQHIVLQVPGEQGGRVVRRAYSLAGWQKRPRGYELAIKREPDGMVSRLLHDGAQVQAQLAAGRPKGDFHWGLAKDASHIALVAGGIGITPMRAMLHGWMAQSAPPRVTLHFSARSRDQLYFDAEFWSIAAKYAWFRYRPRLTKPEADWQGETGRLTAGDILQDLPVESGAVFLCANRAMEDGVVAGLQQAGFPGQATHRESFGIEAAATDIQVTITYAGRSFAYDGAPTLLHALLDHDIDIPAECRAGECGACRLPLRQGRVRNLLTGTVSEAEALTCCVVPEGDLVLGEGA